MNARLQEHDLDELIAFKRRPPPLRPADDPTDERFDVTNRAMRPVFLVKARRPSLVRPLARWALRKARSNWYLLGAFLAMVALSAAFPGPWWGG